MYFQSPAEERRESAFVPAATAPPAAAVDKPNELAAQDFAACPNSFHVCPLLGATTESEEIPIDRDTKRYDVADYQNSP